MKKTTCQQIACKKKGPWQRNFSAGSKRNIRSGKEIQQSGNRYWYYGYQGARSTFDGDRKPRSMMQRHYSWILVFVKRSNSNKKLGFGCCPRPSFQLLNSIFYSPISSLLQAVLDRLSRLPLSPAADCKRSAPPFCVRFRL